MNVKKKTAVFVTEYEMNTELQAWAETMYPDDASIRCSLDPDANGIYGEGVFVQIESMDGHSLRCQAFDKLFDNTDFDPARELDMVNGNGSYISLPEEISKAIIAGLLRTETSMTAEEISLYSNVESNGIVAYVDQQMIIVPVEGGKLRAIESCDPDYPGIYTDFIRDQDSIEMNLSLVEYQNEEVSTEEQKQIVMHLWSNACDEDTTHRAVVPLQDLTRKLG